MMNDKGLVLSPLFAFNNKYGGMNNELQGNEKYHRADGKRELRRLYKGSNQF